MHTIAGTNPYTAQPLDPVAVESSADEVKRVVNAARDAVPYLDGLGRDGRGQLLRSIADGLDNNAKELIASADEETAIGPSRLAQELKRASYQMRFFADVLREGSYLEATIDTATDTPMGPRPDLRRVLHPVGPIAVFGSSNFPFAFSVPGGDTASALAAGCPVVLKAHSSHPRTSRLSHDIMISAISDFGGPAGVLGLVFGQDAGLTLVGHPAIQAVGFTGSLNGGEALMEAISRRPQPIPFYGELSSLNPLVVTPCAASERGHDIGVGLAASITTSAGQLCTKPGVVLIPHGQDGDSVVSSLSQALKASALQPLLNRRILEGYAAVTQALAARDDVKQLFAGDNADRDGFSVNAVLHSIEASCLVPGLVEECFGPAAVVVRYSSEQELQDALSTVQESLTLTIQFGEADKELVRRLTDVGRARAGRIIYNGFPTGVSVSWAQTHGGPWPATNSLHTSVGATAIRRFLRPMTYQDAPAFTLPDELKDDHVLVPTRINGELVLPNGR